jgi:16S rRNA (cytosine1402-N4)-methyltransferase
MNTIEQPPKLNQKNEHTSVLYHEVLEGLMPQPGGYYLDGTLGMGGHAWGILYASSPTGKLLALDQDPTAITIARQRLALFTERLTTVRSNFVNMKRVASQIGLQSFDGILLDLGFCSVQMNSKERGLSFQSNGPLDMRLDPDGPTKASDLINDLDQKALADLIYQYGEERYSRRIARAIVQNRPFSSAKDLGDLIARVMPKGYNRIHPATKTFQAIRIAVNGELDVLKEVLPVAVSLLKPGGRLAVISFHSLEDRMVKHFFRREMTNCLCSSDILFCRCEHQAILDRALTTRKPIIPTKAEIQRNPRARSAKLRVAVRLSS